MTTRKWLSVAFGMLLFAWALTSMSVKADGNPAKTTYFTFNQPVQLPGVALNPGTYIFELASPFDGGSGLVRVMSRDRRTSYFMGFTIRVDRPRGLGPDAVVTFGEAERGSAPPIIAWWPLDESAGHAFSYR